MKMYCGFCENELDVSHFENGSVVVYQCSHCPLLILYYFTEEDNLLIKTAFRLEKKGKSYLWTNNHRQECSYITDITVFSPNKGHLVDFPKIMNINPTNVYDKFSLWMTFL